MPRKIVPMLMGFASLIAAGGVGRASTLQWSLVDVAFNDGTPVTGTFTYDSDTGLYTDWSITVAAQGAFSDFVYDPADSTAQTCCDDAISLTSNDMSRSFNLDYNSAADPTDPLQSSDGNESGMSSIRFAVAGSEIQLVVPDVTGTPEPGSLSLLGAGLLLFFVSRRRTIAALLKQRAVID